MSEGLRFRIHETLGSGNFGEVYRASLDKAHGLQLDVALKIMKADASGRLLQRFRDEARVLGLLQHDAVVRVHELCLLETREWAVAMELVPGLDLAQIAMRADEPIPRSVLWHVGMHVAGALEHAWSHTPNHGAALRLEHRDIKPANILLTAFGQVKVLDFGIAKAMFSSREAKTAHQGRFGTPPYMSPARWTGLPDPAADVFALGTTLIQLLLLRPAPSVPSYAKQREWRLKLLEDAVVAAPEAADLLRSMLAKNPDDRPTNLEAKERLRELSEAERDPHPAVWCERVVGDALRDRLPTAGRYTGRTVGLLQGDRTVESGTLVRVTVSGEVRTPEDDDVPAPAVRDGRFALAVVLSLLLVAFGMLCVLSAVLVVVLGVLTKGLV